MRTPPNNKSLSANQNSALMAIYRTTLSFTNELDHERRPLQRDDLKRAIRELSNLRNAVEHGKCSPREARQRVVRLLADPAQARDTYAF